MELKEEDGIDYAAVTVQLPGGERVPFLFTIKELEAKGTADAFGGEFVVPSYRGSSFLDPKVPFKPFCKLPPSFTLHTYSLCLEPSVFPTDE